MQSVLISMQLKSKGHRIEEVAEKRGERSANGGRR